MHVKLRNTRNHKARTSRYTRKLSARRRKFADEVGEPLKSSDDPKIIAPTSRKKPCVARGGLKGKCIDFSSMVQKKDNLISVRMAYLSLSYDKPNLPNRQLYTHVAIATSAVMTYERLSSTTEKVDHCGIWSFSIGLLYSRSERRAVSMLLVQ